MRGMAEGERARTARSPSLRREDRIVTQTARTRLTMAMLLLVYTFNFIDRQIIGVLAIPIKAELGLSDTRLGLMGGLAFALFYTALGVPIALLADRSSRKWIITGSLALWSLFTALCGAATGFWQLFLCRLGVGIGEAGGVAPAYSLIADEFPPEKRGRAMAIFSLGIPLGSALGVFFGGWLATHFSWRMAFVTVGLAGLVLAPIFALAVKEPVRGRFDTAPAGPRAPVGETLRRIVSLPTFWLISLGAASSSILSYGLAFWLPAFFGRSLKLPLDDLSLWWGTVVLVGGVAGVWLGGVAGDRLGQARKAWYGWVPAAAFALALPFMLLAVLGAAPGIAFFLFLAPYALGLVWLGPVIAAVQHLVPPDMRATASALFLFVNNLIGIGLGTLLFGLMSDRLAPQFGDDALRMSILIGTCVFYPLAAIFFWAAGRTLDRVWLR